MHSLPLHSGPQSTAGGETLIPHVVDGDLEKATCIAVKRRKIEGCARKIHESHDFSIKTNPESTESTASSIPIQSSMPQPSASSRGMHLFGHYLSCADTLAAGDLPVDRMAHFDDGSFVV